MVLAKLTTELARLFACWLSIFFLSASAVLLLINAVEVLLGVSSIGAESVEAGTIIVLGRVDSDLGNNTLSDYVNHINVGVGVSRIQALGFLQVFQHEGEEELLGLGY